MDEPKMSELVARMTLLVTATAQCKAALEPLDSVTRGRVVSALHRMFAADVRAYGERAVAVLRTIFEEAGAEDTAPTLTPARIAELEQDDKDTLVAMAEQEVGS